jgi:hypothetical protein
MEPIDGVYKIWNAEGVKAMASHPEGSFEILCNIDMQGAELAPIGTEDAPFTGTINGANYVISNFTVAGEAAGLGFVGVGSGKLTDVRLANGEIKAMLSAARVEYYMMAGMLLANIPLLYVLNQDWYAALMHTVLGKVVLAICGMAILVTYMLMTKFTKPIEYRK